MTPADSDKPNPSSTPAAADAPSGVTPSGNEPTVFHPGPFAQATPAASVTLASAAPSSISASAGAPPVTPPPVSAPPVAPPAAAAPSVVAPEVTPPPREPPKAKPVVEPDEPPPRKRRRRSKTARSPIIVFLNGLMSFITLLVVGAGAAVLYGKTRFEQPGPLTEARVVLVPKGQNLDQISDTLQRAGVVSEGWIFGLGARFMKVTDQIKAGEYEFKPGASMADVVEAMVEGHSVQHTITFPEGWTSEQIVRRLQDEGMLVANLTAIPEEGSLMPDTYKFSRGDTKASILEKMRHAQDRRLADVWKARAPDLPLATPRDLVILASIVEKETGKPEERPRVAAVFVNRLRKNMRLETDPTVLYGLYGGKAWVEGRTLTRSDLAAPNPYNTYKINGLPPGPIGNPGRAALEAVANPMKTNELFFVADGTGGHVFAETLDEHNKNVQRWRQIEQQRRSGADPLTPLQGAGTGTGVAPVATPAQPAAGNAAGALRPTKPAGQPAGGTTQLPKPN